MTPSAKRAQAFLNVTRSVTERAWRDRLDPPAQAAAEAMAQRDGVPDLLARVLAGRGVTSDTLADTLEPTLKRLMPDPSVLTGMSEAVCRLADAVLRREPIAIFGDYDVDGACSAALMARILRQYGAPPHVHIPDRLTEGYGPNIPAIEEMARRGIKLLVTVDCGTTSFEPLARARELGLDTVVIDHHLADAMLPEAVSIVNPNRQDDLSGLGQLCATGVAFMVLVALLREFRSRGVFAGQPQPDLRRDLDLVALATVADIVPLTGLNRAFVARGLEALHARSSPGLRALQDVSRVNGPVEPYHLGFLLGPRINAGGRIGDAGLGARLLLSEDDDECAVIAATLDRLNRERQVVEQAHLAEAFAEADAAIGAGEGPAVIVTSGEHWHPGVVGLVAARLAQRLRRPAFALAFDGERAVGSGRSIQGVDLGRTVRRAVAEGLLEKGGGHAMAAGITVARGRLSELRAFFEQELAAPVAEARLERTLLVDGALTGGAATPDVARMIARAGPFGSGCPEPVFAFPAQRVVYADEVGNGHVRVTLQSGDGARLKGVAFRAAREQLGQALLDSRGRALHVAGQLVLDRWQGDERVECRIIDAARPETV